MVSRVPQNGFVGGFCAPEKAGQLETGRPGYAQRGRGRVMLLAHVDRLTDTAARMLDAEKAMI
jgi:hypothetical protein